MAAKECVLEDRLCTDCGECDRCDIHADKRCDNCGECLESDADTRAIAIDAIFLNEQDKDCRSCEDAPIGECDCGHHHH